MERNTGGKKAGRPSGSRSGQGSGRSGQGSGRSGQGSGRSGQGSSRSGQGSGRSGQGSGNPSRGRGKAGPEKGRSGEGRKFADSRKPGDDRKPGEGRKFADSRKPGDDRKPGEGRKFADSRKPGDDRKPGEGRKFADSRKPGDDRKPGEGRKFADNRKPGDSRKAGGGRKKGGGKKAGDASIRLNKYIAASGICSRREADQLISAGLVSINGKVISELGTKVQPGDDVRYNGNRLQSERKMYVLLNKPKDYVTTTDDPRERRTVMALVQDACKERIYPVGRLDRQTTGVLLFTNDGEMAKRLTHPSNNKKKIYHIFLDKGFTAADMRKLSEGIVLDDGEIQADAVSYVKPDSKKEVGLEIHSGRNRIVRRMFEHLGYKVVKLDRVYFAGLTKKDLPRGKWRMLSEREVNRLNMNAYE